jgi:hypothetical protein
MRRILQWSLSVSVILGSIGAQAQWVPLVGKIRQTREVTAGGQVLEKNMKAGVHYRSSNGSTLRMWTEVNGAATQNVVGELMDNISGTTYRVEYLNKRALTLHQSGPLEPDTYSSPNVKPAGQDIVAGVTCNLFPVTNMATGHADARMCISSEYGLVLRLESWFTRKDGATVRAVTEFYELTLNKEPDPKLFDLSGLSVEKTVPVASR